MCIRDSRDEDLRADRQPEFTQVDEEMSFVNEDDIMTINEGLIKRLWKEMLGVDVQTPFVRMPWDEAMGRFGSDKPDTRFGLEIVDVTDIFDGTEFKPFAAVLEQGGSIRAINAKGLAGKLTRKHIDKLGEVAKTYGAKGLAFSRLTEEGTSSSFEKFLTEEEKAALRQCIEREMEQFSGYLNDTLLYDAANGKFDALFARNGVKNKNNLFSICAYLFQSEFYFRRPHIAREKLERGFSIETVLVNHLQKQGRFDYRDLSAFAKQLGFADSTILQMFSRHREEILRIGRDEYLSLIHI